MGNSDPSEHAEWKSKSFCGHWDHSKVTKYRWITVPMSNGFATGAADVGRGIAAVATLGLSTVVNGGIKDLSHECIEVLYECRKCGSSGRFTTEIINQGNKVFACGFYAKEFSERRSYSPSNKTLRDAYNIYDGMTSNYDLVKTTVLIGAAPIGADASLSRAFSRNFAHYADIIIW
eukprot:CAMPEP_0197058498 /NCGR_PEP_ID=MMETSP1384-20130603/108580_1 /TAXON_ID=29189 /ORGANISM="Ammonia sp." /LENGTH=175 /DNA_ID=CAMNT_0042493275 /DNA_START=49 /DNA_END=574 /DNA_ORIENTATION=-